MASSASPLAQEDAWPDVLEAEAATKGAGNENGPAVSVHLLHLRHLQEQAWSYALGAGLCPCLLVLHAFDNFDMVTVVRQRPQPRGGCCPAPKLPLCSLVNLAGIAAPAGASAPEDAGG